MERIVLGGGCFWCLEAVFQRVPGVQEVVPAYAGGATENPTYEQVCSGSTGHAEVVAVTFDENKVALRDLLTVFFSVHDPTTINRQGADVGSQYRSILLFDNPHQKSTAEAAIKIFNDQHVFEGPIVTEVQPLTKLYPAERDHYNYYNQNRRNPYCQMVIAPKIAKLENVIGVLKEEV